MTLQTLIADRLANRNINDIASQLGYSSKDKILIRINSIISSPYLLLDQSSFDFRFSTPELIRKLCVVLDIPALMYNRIIDEIENALIIRNLIFKPYIFIETNFKRDNQPIFQLAAMDGERYIKIETELAGLSLNEQLSDIVNIIKEHYRQQPTLPMWGDVKQYVYFYDDETMIIFSTSGELLNVVSNYRYARAKMDLVKVIVDK